MDYRVQLDVYDGPLDLLLFLIRRNELDIYDIPLAEVTRQYCQFVECLHAIDPDAAAEFMVLATTLMEIKSRMLLPSPPPGDVEAEESADPRANLVRQLLEYKRFKDASRALDLAARLQASRWPRAAGPLQAEPASCDLDDVQIWDLVGAFNKLMVSIGRDRVSHEVMADDTPIALHAADILDRLTREGDLPFEAVFQHRSKPEMIGLFLALLELIRQRRVRVEQAEVFDQIRIVLLSAEPITVGEEWEYRAADEAAADGDGSMQVSSATTASTTDDDDAALGDPDESEGFFASLEGIRTDVDDATLKPIDPTPLSGPEDPA